MTILVTGCAGFIGSRVSALLVDQGHNVVGVDNLNDAYHVRLKEWRLAQLEGTPGFTFQRLDIADRDGLRPLFERSNLGTFQPFDAVINLAARAGVRQSVRDPWAYYETNVVGALNMLDACREHGVTKFIQASTSSVYGSPAQGADGQTGKRADGQTGRRADPDPDANSPTSERANSGRLGRPFREDDPTSRPLSPYAASKKAAEELCHSYHHLYGLDVTVLRYFTVYGPAGRPDMSVFRFIKWIDAGEPVTVYGDGTQERDFTYVDDIARGTVAALGPLDLQSSNLQPSTFNVLNLGSDRPVALRDVIGHLERLLDRRAVLHHEPAEPTDVPATWADITRARRSLHWFPQTELEDGLAAAVAWYRDNHSWAGQAVASTT